MEAIEVIDIPAIGSRGTIFLAPVEKVVDQGRDERVRRQDGVRRHGGRLAGQSHQLMVAAKSFFFVWAEIVLFAVYLDVPDGPILLEERLRKT